ncbi:fasciclin domain-containing protein [Robertkochia marina]|uniref:Fasciclin domain-containing protein n=1 Tax=Robertkochia marina TaxID=1227945 RepID=A0A4S3LZN9_9FLAO|nr:fasciclin domain-containing protein [Robertkochia marina]THD65843.1 fasciclin domain-containing protein [Robertkochia marina]TRZ41346.1 fasciclin domain-containing protein [Robertkochia marina]
MKKLFKTLMLPLVLTVLVPLSVNAQHEDAGTEESAASATVVGVAASNADFSTLVTAVQAAELAETLSGEGPFTVFAPTNDAFGKLPEGTVESLVQPENKEQLTSILTYHVVAGEYNAEAVINAINSSGGSFMIQTVQGGELTASLEDGKVILTDAQGNRSTVVMTDVEASNGIIHVIDTVVMP